MASVISFFTNKISFLAFVALPCLVIAGLIFRNCVKNVKRDIATAMAELLEQERQEEAVATVTAVEFKNVRGAKSRPMPDTPASPAEEPKTRTKKVKIKETTTAESVFAGLSNREYEEMCARIRAELMEELKKENDRE